MSHSHWLPVAATACAIAAATYALKRRRRRSFRAATAAEAKAATQEPWDYIIVGGGTAGCVLANRLSTAGCRVLVLEAGHGDHESLYLRIPAGVLNTFQSKYDWFFTSNEGSSTIAHGHGLYIARGKVLGGSSNLNVLLYTRGNASDYDAWVADYGCEGWSSEEVLRCFKRTEDDRTGLAADDPAHHSRGGEWAVDHVRYQNPLSRCFLQAGVQAGYRSNSDFNSWRHIQEGVGRFPVSEKNGSRCSAASALLVPALASGKLTVLCGAQVARVLVDSCASTTGVEFWAGGVKHIARLAQNAEVLLTGGAIHSPQLLMVSGIGPASHLSKHGIHVVLDLPGVGQNLQDQPAANLCFECPPSKNGVSPTSHVYWFLGKKYPHPFWMFRWLFFGSGPLTSPGCDHGGFFSLDDCSSPELQMRFLPARAVTADGMNSFATFRQKRDRLPDGFSFQAIAVRPHSRGTVELASADIRDSPTIRGGYLTDERDMRTLREGLRLARHLAQQQSFVDYRGEEVFPGKGVQSDEELDNYIAQNVHTANAVVGTCRMGRPDDDQAVCDSQLRVLGVRGLRVCDSSVMPRLPGCQAGAPTVMIAERAAEFLLGR